MESLDDTQPCHMDVDTTTLPSTTNLISTLSECNEEGFLRETQKLTLHHKISLFSSSQNIHGETILHQLASTINRSKILWILECIPQEERLSILLKPAESGQTVLHMLAYNAQTALILAILDLVSPSTVFTLLKAQSSNGDTVAHCIAKCGGDRNVALIKRTMEIMTTNQKLNLLKAHNKLRYTAVHLCVKNKDLALALCFIQCIDERDRLSLLKQQTRTGRTVIHIAVDQNNLSATQDILNTLPESAKTALLAVKTESKRAAVDLAVKRNFTEPLKVLLPYTPCTSNYILHRAVMHNNPEIVYTVLEQIQEEQRLEILSHPNENGRTAMHLAIKQSNLAAIKQMINCLQRKERLSLFSIQDDQGQTVLHLAVLLKSYQIIDKILESLTLEDRVTLMQIVNHTEQNTALHLAIMTYDLGVLKSLVEATKLSEVLIHMISAPNSTDKTVLQEVLTSNNELTSYLLNSLSPIHRLNIISECTRTDAHNLLNHATFTSAEASYLSTNPGRNGGTFLHLTAKLNHYEATKKFLSLLNEEDRIKALSSLNSSGKTPHRIASSEKLKSLLAWSKKQKGFYYLPTAPEVLIMYCTEDRVGAEEESNQLEQILSKFKLQPTVKKDLTAKEMLSEIRNVAAGNDDISGLIVVVMGHGEKGAICAKDNETVRYQDILSAMYHPSLDGKPKVLLAQSCQVQNSQRANVRLDHRSPAGSSANQMYDPATPGKENQQAPVTVTKHERNNIIQLVTHFCQHPSIDGPITEPPEAIFNKIAPESAPSNTRAAVWNASKNLLAALQRFQRAQTGECREEDASCISSDTDKTHYDIVHDDVIAIMASVNGGVAVRGELLPIFADQLREAKPNDDIYEIFVRTHSELKRKVPEQVAEFRSTLTKKLCLKNIMSSKTATSSTPASVSSTIFSCVRPQNRDSRNPFGMFRNTM